MCPRILRSIWQAEGSVPPPRGRLGVFESARTDHRRTGAYNSRTARASWRQMVQRPGLNPNSRQPRGATDTPGCGGQPATDLFGFNGKERRSRVGNSRSRSNRRDPRRDELDGVRRVGRMQANLGSKLEREPLCRTSSCTVREPIDRTHRRDEPAGVG